MWESIITVVAIAIILPFVFQLFYFLQRREEKRLKPQEFNRTKAPQAVCLFFLIIAALFFGAAIASSVWAIVAREPLLNVIIFAVAFSLIAALPLFGYLYTRFRYEIYDNEKVTVVRFFKTKTVYFSEISYYSYFAGMTGGLTAYDKNGVTLFASEGINVGIEKFVYEFAVRGIRELNRSAIQPTFGANPAFIKYKKKTNFKIWAWVSFGFAIFCFIMFPLFFSTNDYKPYENYAVEGTVSELQFKNNSITLKLDGDENSYLVNNLVYNVVSPDFKNFEVKGENIKILVAYTDKYERRNVSQIVYRGVVFLGKEEAEAAERENFENCITLSYVFLGVGCTLLVIWGAFLIIIKVKYGNCENCAEKDKKY